MLSNGTAQNGYFTRLHNAQDARDISNIMEQLEELDLPRVGSFWTKLEMFTQNAWSIKEDITVFIDRIGRHKKIDRVKQINSQPSWKNSKGFLSNDILRSERIVIYFK